MKAYILWVLACFSFLHGVQAQLRMDNIWFSGGYEESSTVRRFFTIDFGKPKEDRFDLYANMDESLFFHNNSSISRPSGELALLTNGCLMLGPGLEKVFEDYDSEGFDCFGGYFLLGGSLLLPHPDDTSRYHFMNLRLRSDGKSQYIAFLKHTDLAVDLNESASVESDNEILVEDSLASTLTAVQHGNGRDWWVFTQRLGGDFYRTLLTPDGFKEPEIQHIGPDYQAGPHGIGMYIGQMCFSPDGRHMATYYEPYGLCIYDFDRCSGLLSNPQLFYLDTSQVEAGGGVAFSEDSRFLYCFSWRVAYQLDMHATDLGQSLIVLDTFDGFESPMFFKTTFWQPRLTPDGQIYVGTTYGTDYWHVVEYPNRPGKACNFQQHALQLPTYCGSPPNIPYYRSGPAKDSPCDTLTPKPPLEPCELSFFPNPADHTLNIEVCDPGAQYEVFDVIGRRIYESEITIGPQLLHIPTRDWASGSYLLRERQSKKTQKVVIQH